MPTINALTAVDTVAAGDAIPVYSSANGDARKASVTVLQSYMQSALTLPSAMDTQYASPSATGFTVAITDSSASTWLILTPTAGFAAGTLTLPASTNAVDKQELLVNCTQAVTTLTVSGNGATVTGAPTTLAANAAFRLRYNASNTTWYRVSQA
jgi:hypothetical protein